MYNTKTATVVNEEFSSSRMSVGINTDVTLKDISVEKSPTGLDFIRFTFEDKDGKTAEMTEWKNTKNMFIKTDEDLQKRDDAQFGRILQIINCFMENIPDAEFNTFVDMINWVKSTLDPLLVIKKKLRLKVIYDKNGYVKVSNNGIFVEPMDVVESQIKLFKRDLLERPIQADKEKSDPFSSNTISETEKNDDLPF